MKRGPQVAGAGPTEGRSVLWSPVLEPSAPDPVAAGGHNIWCSADDRGRRAWGERTFEPAPDAAVGCPYREFADERWPSSRNGLALVVILVSRCTATRSSR